MSKTAIKISKLAVKLLFIVIAISYFSIQSKYVYSSRSYQSNMDLNYVFTNITIETKTDWPLGKTTRLYQRSAIPELSKYFPPRDVFIVDRFFVVTTHTFFLESGETLVQKKYLWQ